MDIPESVPAVLMRGGTSKALVFHDRDLPPRGTARDDFIVSAFGSPDPYGRQLDGLGGGTSSTSKVAIVAPADEPGVDVSYEFGQVSISSPFVVRTGGCGNIAAAIGPFAIDEGLVAVAGEMTDVRILNLNTGKSIVAHVPTSNGRFDPAGDFEIPGVPGRGCPIALEFIDPGGAVTGRLLPTGSPREQLETESGPVEASVVDAGNPVVFLRISDLGLTGLESVEEVNADADLLRRVEEIRSSASVAASIASDRESALRDHPSVPLVALVGPPRDYETTQGSIVRAESHSLRVMMFSMGRMHPSCPMTGAVSTAAAATLSDTIVAESLVGAPTRLQIGHSSGVISVGAVVVRSADTWQVSSVSLVRTARRLFKGVVFAAPDSIER